MYGLGIAVDEAVPLKTLVNSVYFWYLYITLILSIIVFILQFKAISNIKNAKLSNIEIDNDVMINSDDIEK
jgi:hypothetical protein